MPSLRNIRVGFIVFPDDVFCLDFGLLCFFGLQKVLDLALEHVHRVPLLVSEQI